MNIYIITVLYMLTNFGSIKEPISPNIFQGIDIEVSNIKQVELTAEELDCMIADIYLRSFHPGDESKDETIRKLLEYKNITTQDIRESHHRLLNNSEETLLVACIIASLSEWGNESSIKELRKFIDNNPATNNKSFIITQNSAYRIAFELNDFETNLMLEYLRKRGNDGVFFVHAPLVKKICSKYKTTTIEKKQYYIEKIKLVVENTPENEKQDIQNYIKENGINFLLLETNSNITNPAVAEKKGQEEKSGITQNSDKKYPITMWAIVGFFTLTLTILGILCKLRTKKNN